MKKNLLLLSFLLVTAGAMAQNKIYAKFYAPANTGIKDIEGTETIGSFTKALLISTFTNSIENKATIGSATSGAGGGKVSFNEVTITKPFDATSLDFFSALAKGAHYSKVDFVFTGSDGKILFVRSFGTVFITSYQTDAAACSTNCPGVIETINFSYGAQMTQIYNSNTNTPSSISPVQWNQINNTATFPNP